MDAVSATIVDGRRAMLLKTQRSIEKKYFSFILSVTTDFFSTAASANPLDGSPARWIVQICQIHAAGRANGSATMVGDFIALLWVVVDWLVMSSSSYVENYEEITLR